MTAFSDSSVSLLIKVNQFSLFTRAHSVFSLCLHAVHVAFNKEAKGIVCGLIPSRDAPPFPSPSSSRASSMRKMPIATSHSIPLTSTDRLCVISTCSHVIVTRISSFSSRFSRRLLTSTNASRFSRIFSMDWRRRCAEDCSAAYSRICASVLLPCDSPLSRIHPRHILIVINR